MYVKHVKKEFKVGAGRSLRVKELSSNDSFDVITASSFSPRRTAYYKRTTTFQVS